MTMTNLDDHTLIIDFKNSRRPECFAMLFVRYGRRIFALAYAFHRERGQAEDCVQETFLRALVEIDRYDETVPTGNFWGWLQAIARNVCIDELRRSQRRNAFAVELNFRTGSLTQDQAVMLVELRRQLRLLSPECCRSYLMSADGYSYKEIMDATGLTYGQVKTSIQTAKRHLIRQFRPAS